MRNFDKKVKYLSSLFVNKFKLYDHQSQKLKIYYISPDNQHMFLVIETTPFENEYACEVGNLYFDFKGETVFEDAPMESFKISKADFKIFRSYYDQLSNWHVNKIPDIANLQDKKDLDLVF